MDDLSTTEAERIRMAIRDGSRRRGSVRVPGRRCSNATVPFVRLLDCSTFWTPSICTPRPPRPLASTSSE